MKQPRTVDVVHADGRILGSIELDEEVAGFIQFCSTEFNDTPRLCPTIKDSKIISFTVGFEPTKKGEI